MHKRALIRKAGKICAVMDNTTYYHAVHIPYYIVEIDGPVAICSRHYEETKDRDKLELLLKVCLESE